MRAPLGYLKDLGPRSEIALFIGLMLFYFGYMAFTLWLALTGRI